MFPHSSLGYKLFFTVVFPLVASGCSNSAHKPPPSAPPSDIPQLIIAKQRFNDTKLLRGKKRDHADALLVNAFMDMGFVIEPAFDQSLGKRTVKRLFICQAYEISHLGFKDSKIPVTARIEYFLTEIPEGTEVRLSFDYNACQSTANIQGIALQRQDTKKQSHSVYRQVWASLGETMFLEEINLSAKPAQ